MRAASCAWSTWVMFGEANDMKYQKFCSPSRRIVAASGLSARMPGTNASARVVSRCSRAERSVPLPNGLRYETVEPGPVELDEIVNLMVSHVHVAPDSASWITAATPLR